MGRKPKLILVTLCSSLICSSVNADGLFSWFGNHAGDDGKASTVGNPSAKTQITSFNVINNSINEINTVNILDKNGKLIYSGTLNCGVGKKCLFNISANVALNSKLTLKFMNKSKGLVSAYIISRSSTLNNILLNESWLGIYVFNQLVKTSNGNPQALNSQLTNAFRNVSSPDRTNDIFEELGLYFLAQNGGADEGKFYTTLNRKLTTNPNISLGSSVSKKPAVLAQSATMSTSSTPSICDSSVTSTLSYIQNISSLIPVVGDAFGAVFGITGQALNDACPATMEQNVADRFAKIDSRLDMIDTQIDELKYDLKAFHNLFDSTNKDNMLAVMNENDSLLRSQYYSKYEALTTNGDLSSFVKNNNLKDACVQSPNLSSLLNNIPDQLTKFDNLISNDKIVLLNRSLNSLCSNPNAIAGDVINTRVNCNIALAKVSYTIDLNAIKIKAMLKDEVTVIANAYKAKKINDDWLVKNASKKFMYGGTSYEWSQASDVIESAINKKTEYLKNTLFGDKGAKRYDPLGGFPDSLSDSIKSAKCVSGNLPAIKEWHTTNPPYILTECDDGTGTKINSKYYYNKRGTNELDAKVVNAMGVLVSDRFFHGDSGNNYADNNAYPVANTSTILQSVTKNDVSNLSTIVYKVNFNMPSLDIAEDLTKGQKAYKLGNGASFGVGAYPKQNTSNILLPGGGNNTEATIFKEEYSGQFITTYLGNTTYAPLYAILRYTKDGNISYVWVMRTWVFYDKGNAVADYYYNLQAAPQCLTNDCNVNNTGDRLEQLKFLDGTTISWKQTIETRFVNRAWSSEYYISME